MKQHFNFLKRNLTKEIKEENEKNWEAFCDDMELDGQNNDWKKNKKSSKYKTIKYEIPISFNKIYGRENHKIDHHERKTGGIS